MSKRTSSKQLAIYQAKNGAIAFRGDLEHDTIWGNLNQISDLFDVQKPAISKHLKHIYESGELDKKTTVSILETVQKEGKRMVTRKMEYYNLDAILSIGYRVNSKQATQFRTWATNILKQHLIQGYTINKQRIESHYEQFLHAVAEVKSLLPKENNITSDDILELVNAFASTWFSLDAYDKDTFPKEKISKKSISVDAAELLNALGQLKQDLIAKKQTTKLFAQERKVGSVEGIIGNIFQTAFGKDVYPDTTQKAAHLLYFMVKNHPFVDGNKRSGAFAFIWFLRKAGLLRPSLTPETLTALTLLIAESNPKDKEKMVGLVMMLII
ncbi:MAG: death-on-curing protein [Candidatus Magasanikbacteria bacterium CG_4_9_14_0_2_um_filter_42_11]|uniref:Death-on-curing protein n=1 Tax=Candidatus Magasanikbacteria bacterium CG_4_9_14_0_2_um_filter_42_11 TaxID=1974643 RepID=A0A2M8FB76_9BACT|nr:MAG: death-on-curing protein [Candidatus Magasanikbacteria bacterium CG10_big_fil_rev_8_21_14_0_10_43_9]PIY92166.1 MAG: death-on-curing protein [Candidatus Magasanikbacteria bacterium CG_4_10_14_0_8_um_filter_42_12]PJC52983.1 MAG: death-on-curing protein [Candidatus Magasanikbacteria bacterium CG_4_9_14_0_2_um_filter_42_11]